MRHKAGFPVVLISTFFALTPSRVAYSQETSGPSEGVQADGQGGHADDLVKQLADLKQNITRLEEKIDRLVARPSEFTPIEVRIVDERRESLSGFKVKLASAGDVQAAEATGVSDHDGIGLTRDLPYGKYWMTIHGQGWYARELLTLEVGKRLELKVIAPASDQLGQLALDASLQPDAVEDLAFGEWEIKGDSGWGTRLFPEPGEIREYDSVDWKSFPAPTDGVEVVAVSVHLSVERRIEQPDGSHVDWEWRRPSATEQSPHLLWLVQSDGKIHPLLEVAEKHKPISKQVTWFQSIAPEDDGSETKRPGNYERLGYHYLKLGEKLERSNGITLPAGRIKLNIDDMYGRPTQAVLQAIDEQAVSSSGRIWLRAAVRRRAGGWLGRLLGESWNNLSPDFEKTIELAPGDNETVTIGTGR